MTLSLLKLLELLGSSLNSDIPVSYDDWRPGDQKVYISNISRAKQLFGWQPVIYPDEGVQRLLRWIQANQGLFG